MLYTVRDMRSRVRQVNPKWEPARQLYERIISRPVSRLVSRVRRIAAGARRRRRTCLLVAVCIGFAGLLAAGILAGHWATGRIVWYCVAVTATLSTIVAQTPRRETIDVALGSLGSIAFTIHEHDPKVRAKCRIEADAALIPVQEAWPAEAILAKLCVHSFGGESWNAAPQCRIAVAKREWLREASEPAPFLIERVGPEDARELAILMQYESRQGVSGSLAWRQSDNAAPMDGIPHEELAVDGRERLEFRVTRGPVAILRTASVEHGFIIQHEDLRKSTYFRLDTLFGKALSAPPVWHQDMSERCLRAGTTDSLRVWREFGSCGPSCQDHYKRQVRFGRAIIDQPTLVVFGDACTVTAGDRQLYTTASPFVAVITKFSHDPCFCTDGFPYLTLVGAEREPGRQPWVVALERGEFTRKPVAATVTISNSSGTIRREGFEEALGLEDYQTVTVLADSTYLAVRPLDAKHYVLRARGGNVHFGNRGLTRSHWAGWPEWTHWVFYSVLTFLWLPILQWFTRLFWGI